MIKPVTHVATTDIDTIMSPGPERRMELPGFAPEFVDFPHYIIRITERVWHDGQIGLCRKWYGKDCVIHTLAGDIVGAEAVVRNTRERLTAFPDRRLHGDNVIWSDEGEGTFYSSHLITSTMTNSGPGEYGAATGRSVRARTLAECLCQNNRIIEEWLIPDALAVVTQLGFDPEAIAYRQAVADRDEGVDLSAGYAPSIASFGHSAVSANTPVSEIAVAGLESMMTAGTMDGVRDARVSASLPGGVSLYGPEEIVDWMGSVWRALSDLRLSVDHIAEIPYLADARDVALRWSATARHSGNGRYGEATGAEVFFFGASQYRVIGGRIREEICLWDDLALRRQIETIRQRR